MKKQLDEVQSQLNKEIDSSTSLQQRLDDKEANIAQLTTQLQHSQDNLDHYRESIRKERETELSRHNSQISRFEGEIRDHLSQAIDRKTKEIYLSSRVQSMEEKQELQLQTINQTQQDHAALMTELNSVKEAINRQKNESSAYSRPA